MMRKTIAAVALGAAMTLSAASAASAAVVGFTLDMAGSLNTGKLDTPLFTLRNTSELASLTSLSLTFSPSDFNIDKATGFTRLDDQPVQLNWVVTNPDTSDNALRADGIWFTFSGFEARNPDEGLRFSLDFDPDSQNGVVEVRNILWNNGALANAILTVGFSDGQTLTQVLPDAPQDQREFHFEGVSSAVPEPATWAMMIAGFGLAGAALRRRRQAPATVAI